MANYLLVRHKVRDFDTWKKAYDAHKPRRDEAGVAEKKLLRGANDPNEVVVLFEASDSGRARAFTESADLHETMQNAGVVDKPDMYFLTG